MSEDPDEGMFDELMMHLNEEKTASSKKKNSDSSILDMFDEMTEMDLEFNHKCSKCEKDLAILVKELDKLAADRNLSCKCPNCGAVITNELIEAYQSMGK